ncbi:hypothetical protein K6119_00545 [Paracrocinitomix mangrovi]|uniref:hypothetical protein n=1 Tax=Paracrocinitomix mangrovi TaxID=2862509 RepID=UPI001C8EF539|nr:hypothetical protein [Paracrocinitomix mangrovi]UKN02003.1 hypothetical protein K6119_00545 [Paracrocinitomix mangrovi]
MRKLIFLQLIISLSSCVKNDCQCKFTEEDLNYGYSKELNYKSYHTIGDAKDCAANCKKPILIMFTGWNTTGNSKLAWEILDHSEIRHTIESNFVFCTLYVDDKTELSNGSTLGDYNIQLESETFGFNTQPLYVITNVELNVLVDPIGYTKDLHKFEAFLQKGTEN